MLLLFGFVAKCLHAMPDFARHGIGKRQTAKGKKAKRRMAKEERRVPGYLDPKSKATGKLQYIHLRPIFASPCFNFIALLY